ncbi:MAG: radical SAM protein [bacterium]|nr:radical SAM protein [bacterium]
MEIFECVLPPPGGRPDWFAKKYLQRVSNGKFIVETTYIRRPEKHIICISTQVGCPIGCKFCASGLRTVTDKEMPYRQSLSTAEIVSQCNNVISDIDLAAHPLTLLLSFMGEGEPFLNFENVVSAFRHFGETKIPVPVRLAVSTSGIYPDLIRRLGTLSFVLPLKLQVSLHGPTDAVRNLIVPAKTTSPLLKIISAVRAFQETSERLVEWNYVLCDGVNDALEHAEQIVALLGSGSHVKFNRLNKVSGSPFEPTPKERALEFRDILEGGNLTTEFYETNESDVNSGCGMLAYRTVARN